MDWNYQKRPVAPKLAPFRALQERRVSPDSGERVAPPSPVAKAPPRGRDNTGMALGRKK